MAAQQDTPGSISDVPKRRKNFFQDIGKKQIIYIVLPLLLINAGVIHIMSDQLKIRAGAQVSVLDVSETAADVGEISRDVQSPQETIVEPTVVDELVITTYVVKSGDTLSGIADKFNITINTIRWANDLTAKSAIKPGQELVILPVSGVEYTVQKGDTLSGIALKFDASQEEILKYNDIKKNAISVGTTLVIPEAEPLPIASPKKTPAPKSSSTTSTKTTTTKTSSPSVVVSTTTSLAPTSTSYATPIQNGILTQGIHDGNAVDFGAAVGTPVLAFKAGTVIVAKSSGYNGGYGNYVVINHEGACQTQYSHLSTLSVAVGDTVRMGETIAKSGNTGRSTGPHLHFNVRNCGGNPFTKLKVGTRF